MKKIIFFSRKMIETIFSLLKVLKHRSFLRRSYLPKINNNKIFILGNGPSLSDNLKDNIDLLKNNNTFCVNDFCLSEYFAIIKPQYYIFLDPAYFIRDNTVELYIQLQESIIEKLSKNVSWNIKIFIPNKTDMKQQWNYMQKNNSNLSIIYFNNNSAHGFDFVCHYLFEKNFAMPEAQNVIIGAIYLSINMGYKNIYLLGVDHSWTEELRVNSKNQLYIMDKHFNSCKEKLFYKSISSEEIWMMHEILKIWSYTFQSYHVLEFYSKKKNSFIYNLVKNSYIDAFQKIGIEEVK